jgi:HSP20 family molecular chaperone IbpA
MVHPILRQIADLPPLNRCSTTAREDVMPNTLWSSVWDLAAAQAQLDTITAALMPLDLAPSGRVQVPSVEIQDTEDTVIVTAFLPGIDPHAVQVRASATGITFFGQRQSGYRHPLSYGISLNHFQHSVPLPVPVQDGAMQVSYSQGAIVVTLPKRKTLGQKGFEALRNGFHWVIAKLAPNRASMHF